MVHFFIRKTRTEQRLAPLIAIIYIIQIPTNQVQVFAPVFKVFTTFTPKFANEVKKLPYFVILLFFSLHGMAQNSHPDTLTLSAPQSELTPRIDSTAVTYFRTSFDSLFLGALHYIDTSTFNASNHEALNRERTVYSTLSNTGQAHKSMRFRYLPRVGFDMGIPAFSATIKTERDMACYSPLIPYSEVRYLMTSGDKEQHIAVKFGRQFLPRFHVSFEFNLDHSPGAFSNNRTDNNHYFWINGRYQTADERYGIITYYYSNKLNVQENGGLADDESYTSHTESDNSVIITRLTNAGNLVKAKGFGLSHYFNLLPRHTKTKAVADSSATNRPENAVINDSLSAIEVSDTVLPSTTADKERCFTLGRLCHSFGYRKNQLFYHDNSPTAIFYQPFDAILDSLISSDSTIIRSIHNSVTWNSLGYKKYSDDIPFYLYAGIDYGIYRIKRYDYEDDKIITDRTHSQLGISGGIIINLFKATRITGQAQLVTLGYQLGDFSVSGQWKQFLGTTKHNIGNLVFDFQMKRQSASWFEQQYYSNHFRWDNHFGAATYLSLAANYQYRFLRVGVKQTTISNMIYFDATAHPAQLNGLCNVREAFADIRFVLRKLELDGVFSLQQTDKSDYLRLPLFLAKLKIAYSQPIFHKAATLQPSLSVQYFTKYYADAYMPALRTFYLQNDVMIGNYPFIDLALSIKVKRANIFLEYSNMFLLTRNYHSFIAPHYPMRDSKIFFGINWRLYK